MANEIFSAAFTEATLYGIKQTLITNLMLRQLPLITTDDVVSLFKKEFQTNQSAGYPYSYLVIGDFGISKEGFNPKTIARAGSGISVDNITNALIAKNYQFDSRMNFTLHYYQNDFRLLMQFVELFSILNATQGFNFKVDLPKASAWTVELYSESDSVSIPQASLEDETVPATYHLEIPLLCKSKAGLVKDVAKVNNTGTVTERYIIDNQVVGIKDGN